MQRGTAVRPWLGKRLNHGLVNSSAAIVLSDETRARCARPRGGYSTAQENRTKKGDV